MKESFMFLEFGLMATSTSRQFVIEVIPGDALEQEDTLWLAVEPEVEHEGIQDDCG